MTTVPSPPPAEVVALAILFYTAGLVTPWYYAQERLRGFGRWMSMRLPYEPPPDQPNKQEALKQAVEQGEESPGDADGDET